MSTVRIYKVAELLNAPSQEVMDLLKVEAVDAETATPGADEPPGDGSPFGLDAPADTAVTPETTDEPQER